MIQIKRYLLLLGSIFIFFSLLQFVSPRSFAQEATPTPTPTPVSETLSSKLKEIEELQNKISDVQSQAKTLSSQISVMNNQIRLTELRISATEQQLSELNEEIETTTKKIGTLEEALSKLTKILLNRIVETYQAGNTQTLQVLLSSGSITDFFNRANYLRIVQVHDKKLIFETQQAKTDYTTQKQIFEDKKKKVETLQKQLETYTAQLDTEKKSKQNLLEATKNDEKRYQDLLARARAEYQAIQGIVAGNGQEKEISDVGEGQKIAEVINGSSCNSGGAHLHFIVSRNGSTENPFSYLKAGVDSENCSGSSCGSSDGDSFNPSGSWNWPIEPKIKMSQGYGSTWATKYTWVSQIYNFHNGLDILGSSFDVKAVKAGKLYQGSYSGYAGCRLRYVRLHHKDDGLDTFYLHINYIF